MLVLELGRKEKIEHLAFSPDGTALAGSGEFGAAIWGTITNGRRADWIPGPRWLGPARFTADGRWLFVASAHVLYRIDPTTGEIFVSKLWGGEGIWFEVSPVAPLFLVAQTLSVTESRLAYWSADDLSPAGKVWERMFVAVGTPRPLFLPGGERVARLEGAWVQERRRNEYRAIVSDPTDPNQLGAADASGAVAAPSLLSPNGALFATRYAGTIDLFPVAGGPSVELRNDSKKFFTDAAFHPGGRFLAATSNDQTVKFYDTANWELARTFTWNIGRVRSIAFSPDGTLAAAGSDKGQVIVWDVDL